ncbi:MAG: hypothetical protein AAF456_13470 [Planctomycetota bacterium]
MHVRSRNLILRFTVAVAVCLVFQAVSPAQSILPSGSSSEDSVMAQGLRERRLFDIAEHFCRSRLDDSELNADDRTVLALELLRTQTSRAAVAPIEESAARWEAAVETAREFIDENRNQPRVLLVEVQKALIHLTHGKLIQQQIAADIIPASERDRALEQLQICNSELDGIARKIKQLIPERRSRQPGEYELTLDQLQVLESNVQFQSAMCTLNRARLYPLDDQLNRINALGLAQEGMETVRRRTSSEQPVWWQNELGMSESHRLLGNLPAALEVVGALPMDEATDATQQAVLREQILIAIAAGDQRAATQLVQAFAATNSPGAELSLAAVQLMMRLSRLDASNSRTWQSQAAGLVSRVETSHGAYWGRLAELELIGATGPVVGENTQPEMTTGTDLDIVLRVGDQAYRKGNLEDALRAYRQAVTTAEAAGNSQVVFTTSINIARILEQRQEYAAAAQAMIQIAARYPDQQNASAVHLRGCWNQAQEVARAKSESLPDIEVMQNDFVTMLNQNISTWPDVQTVDQARTWLAGHFQEMNQWDDAVQTWMSVSPASRWSVEAVRQAGSCMVRKLEELRSSGQPTAGVCDRFCMQLLDMLGDIGSAESDSWTSLHTSIAVALVQLQTGFGAGNIDELEIISRADLNCTSDEKAEVKTWLVVAVADTRPEGTADVDEVIATFATSLPALERCDEGLARLLQRRPDCLNAQEARLALSTAALSMELNDQQTTFWRTRQSSSLVATGRHAEAVELIEGLIAQQPNSAALQMQLARCLTMIEGDEATTRALTQWRRIVRKLRPNSDNWFEAKLNVARLLDRSGEPADALKVLEYLKATGADWSTSAMAEELDSLYIRLQNE